MDIKSRGTSNSSPSSAQDCNNDQVENKTPDGGWGWVVTFSAFIMLVISTTPTICFGVLFSDFLLQLGTSATISSSIYNASVVIANIFAYMFDPLVEVFGWRMVAFISGLLLGFGFIMSAFAHSALFLAFSYSFIIGITMKIMKMFGFVLIPHYFTRWLSLANAITLCGTSVCQMIMPSIITALQDEYGFKGATLIMGALSFNCCVSAMVFHPVEWHLPNSRQKQPVKTKGRAQESIKRILGTAVGNMKLLKSPGVLIITLIESINMPVFVNTFALIPFVMQEKGSSRWESTLCLTIAGCFNLIGKMMTSLLGCCPKIRVIYVLMWAAFLAATALIGFSMAEDIKTKGLSMVLLGGSFGVASSLYNIIIIAELGLPMLSPSLSINAFMTGISFIIFGPLIGKKLLPMLSPSLSINAFMSGISFIIFGPLIGVVQKLTNTYVSILYLFSACFLLSGVLCIITPIIIKLEQPTYTSQNINTSDQQYSQQTDEWHEEQEETSGEKYEKHPRKVKAANEKSPLVIK